MRSVAAHCNRRAVDNVVVEVRAQREAEEGGEAKQISAEAEAVAVFAVDLSCIQTVDNSFVLLLLAFCAFQRWLEALRVDSKFGLRFASDLEYCSRYLH